MKRALPGGRLWGLLLALPLVVPLGAVLGAGAPASAAPADGLAVSSLSVDDATNPLGIDDTSPAFGWKLASEVNGTAQSAYQVVVATTPELASAGSGDVWDSGKVQSSASVAVEYGGPALESQQRYYWAVKVWDQAGAETAWSDAAWWEMGLLDPADWQDARWITPDTGADHDWSDFQLDSDFTIASGAASFLFRASDSGNFYLWQVNTVVSAGKVTLRPHVTTNGNYKNLTPDIDLSAVIAPEDANAPHHITIRAEGSTIITSIDGVEVNRLTESTHSHGTVGFRVGDSIEHSSYDNLTVTSLDGKTLFSDDFSTSPDQWFPKTDVVDGQLVPGGGITLIDSTPSAPLLRDEFTLGKTVSEARAYVYGLGFYELSLNGQKVGDRVLTSPSTPHERRNIYDTYDVTDQLSQGENAVGLWLGDGYDDEYSGYAWRWLGQKQATMLIDVTYDDGSHQTVTTDDGWTWSTGPITSNGIYSGENYDARLEKAGWDTAGYDASSWMPVSETTAPEGPLSANTMGVVRVVDTIRPVALTEPTPGTFIYDLGQNIAGWSRLHVQGDAGTTVTMRTAEEVNPDGTLDTFTNRNAASTDRFTLAGTGAVEDYEPRFTYHGFRYVEVTGFPGTPTLDSLEGRVVHADVTSTGTFDSSDTLLNQIWTMNRWGILNNTMNTPTDTPVRDERTPPGMDVQTYMAASTREFGMDNFYANYLLNMPAGRSLPNDDSKAQNPDMGGAGVTLAWTLYDQYGDLATLATHYDAMKAFVDTNAKNHPDLIWPDGFGDWCPPDRSPNANGGMGNPNAGDCTSEAPIVNTALWYVQAQDVARAAEVLGHPEDAEHFTAMAEDVKTAFNDRFLNDAGDTYGDGRQTTSVLPLAFGLVPDENVEKVGAQLVDTILNKNDGHLDTGIFGTRYLVDALAKIGRIDVAMTVLGQTTYPSYGFEISKGATTPWEQWTYSAGMITHDHAMFAGINSSFYTQLAGIQNDTAGYETVTIDPQVPDSLQHVSASIDTVRGTVSSAWAQSADGFTLDVSVPVNSTATVHVPLRGFEKTTATEGAKVVSTNEEETVYQVGSGTWHFVSANDDSLEVDRIDGATRYDVAVNTSKQGWPDGSGTVYVVSGEVFPDALSAAPAATAADAPILLTPGDRVLPAVADELKRLDPSKIVIVGGVNSVSSAVEKSLKGFAADVSRIAGADRFEVSRNVAKAAFPDNASVAVIATGATFADALSAGAAVKGEGPVILVDGSKPTLDAATSSLLDGLHVDEIAIAGGPQSVSSGIFEAAQSKAHTVRLGGADRYAASRAINAHFVESADRVLIATGATFPDALSGSAFGPRVDAPLFTVPGTCIPAETLAQIQQLGADRVTLLGGVNSLAKSVADLTVCPAG